MEQSAGFEQRALSLRSARVFVHKWQARFGTIELQRLRDSCASDELLGKAGFVGDDALRATTFPIGSLRCKAGFGGDDDPHDGTRPVGTGMCKAGFCQKTVHLAQFSAVARARLVLLVTLFLELLAAVAIARLVSLVTMTAALTTTTAATTAAATTVAVRTTAATTAAVTTTAATLVTIILELLTAVASARLVLLVTVFFEFLTARSRLALTCARWVLFGETTVCSVTCSGPVLAPQLFTLSTNVHRTFNEPIPYQHRSLCIYKYTYENFYCDGLVGWVACFCVCAAVTGGCVFGCHPGGGASLVFSCNRRLVSARETGQTVGESQDENSRESEEHSDAESKGKGETHGDSRCRWSEATALNGAELLLPLVVSFVALAVSSNHCAQTCALRERDGGAFAAACFSRQASVDQLGLFARPGAQDHTPAHAHRQWRTRSPTHGHLLTTCARSASTQEILRVRVLCCARAFVCLCVSLGVSTYKYTSHLHGAHPTSALVTDSPTYSHRHGHRSRHG